MIIYAERNKIQSSAPRAEAAVNKCSNSNGINIFRNERIAAAEESQEWRWQRGMEVAAGNGGGSGEWRWQRGVEVAAGRGGGSGEWRWQRGGG
jgi:hypothetical protein